MIFDRRNLLLSLSALPVLTACGTSLARKTDASPDFAALEAQRGGRVGVMALDLATGRSVSHRPDERFAMCSTFKWMLGGVVLDRVDKGLEDLSRPIEIREADMVFYAPTTKPAIGSSLTVGELCAATIANSDNPAANLLLETMDGPDGFTQALRAMGDDTTRLDRYEPEMNENLPGDPRDTTTPRAMVGSLQALLFGDVLSVGSRDILRGWMLGTTTGARRLKAGLPEGWTLGHKTGTSSNNASNDVGFALSPDSDQPILIASYTNGPEPMSANMDAVHAEVARLAIAALRA